LKRPSGKAVTWVSALLALFLVFVLPACSSGAKQRAFAERGLPLSTSSNEEREERDHCEEHKAACEASLPESDLPHYAEIETAHVVVHRAPTLVASVAAKLHPSRFSERSLR
jgi:hypothetical protein